MPKTEYKAGNYIFIRRTPDGDEDFTHVYLTTEQVKTIVEGGIYWKLGFEEIKKKEA